MNAVDSRSNTIVSNFATRFYVKRIHFPFDCVIEDLNNPTICDDI